MAFSSAEMLKPSAINHILRPIGPSLHVIEDR